MPVKKRKPARKPPPIDPGARDAAKKQLDEMIDRSNKDRRVGVRRKSGQPGKGKIIEQRVHRIDKSTGRSFAEFGRKKRRVA